MCERGFIRCFFRCASVVLLLVVISANILSDTNGSSTTESSTLQTAETQTYTIDDEYVSRKILYLEDYCPMPGDVYVLTIDYGFALSKSSDSNKPFQYTITLHHDYSIELPFIGTMDISDLCYSELRKLIIKKIRAAVPVQFIDFTLEKPAVFDVLAFGNIPKPGDYTVSSLMRFSEFIKKIGKLNSDSSTRAIQIIRETGTITCDLQKYYRTGDERHNPYLRPKDRIFFPRISKSVSLEGAVEKTGIIEITDGEMIEDIVAFAGGLQPTAQVEHASIQRVNATGVYEYQTVSGADLFSFQVHNGDRILIPSSIDSSEKVTVEGAFFGRRLKGEEPQTIPENPIRINIAYQRGITLLRLLEAVGGPTPFAETEKSYLLRNRGGNRIPLPFLKELWEKKDEGKDVMLEPGDYLVVPMKSLTIRVTGSVNAPTTLPYVKGFTVEDCIRRAGGIDTVNGDKNAVYFLLPEGEKRKASFADLVEPGDTVFVDKSFWAGSQQFFTNLFIVTGWVGGIVAVTTLIIDFIVDTLPKLTQK